MLYYPTTNAASAAAISGVVNAAQCICPSPSGNLGVVSQIAQNGLGFAGNVASIGSVAVGVGTYVFHLAYNPAGRRIACLQSELAGVEADLKRLTAVQLAYKYCEIAEHESALHSIVVQLAAARLKVPESVFAKGYWYATSDTEKMLNELAAELRDLRSDVLASTSQVMGQRVFMTLRSCVCLKETQSHPKQITSDHNN